MPGLSKRDITPEIMDDFNLPAEQVEPVLKGLDQMNITFGDHKVITKALEKFTLTNGCYISDWGCGGGQTLRQIAAWAKKKDIKLHLTGIDASAVTVDYARRQSAHNPEIDFICADVLDIDNQRPVYDFVLCSLFLHHFSGDDLTRLLKNMNASARQAVIITDLHRHPILYWAVTLITRVFTRNSMARNDGPLSVKKAFKRHELHLALKNAQIHNYKLTWMWPFRWRLIISKL